MKIRFDFRIFLSQEHGGISRYFINLYTSFLSSKIDVKIWSPFYINDYLRHHVKNNLIVTKIKKEDRILLFFIRILSKIIEQFLLIVSPPDVYHLTYYDYIPFHRKKTKIVLTVYDLIHELYQEEYPSRFLLMKKFAIERADKIICISTNTQIDLKKIYSIPLEKSEVIYLGFNFLSGQSENIEINKLNRFVGKNYILYVGLRGGYKNFEIFLIAFSRSKYLIENFQIICFGGGVFSDVELTEIKKIDLERHVHHLEGDDLMLKTAYQNATLFIYPSLYEGFGIPPLEAMSCGTPVCCSNNSSIPEVVGSAALMFDASDVDDIKKKVLSILKSNETRNMLISKGYDQISKFNWEKCANETLEFYAK